MAEKLKPCPFCGCDGEMSRDFCTAGGKLEWESFRVFHNCKAVGPMATDRFGTEAEAAEAWNQRAERTCRAEERYRDDDSSPWPYYVCSECGEILHYRSVVTEYGEESSEMLPFCAGCGAKVVER